MLDVFNSGLSLLAVSVFAMVPQHSVGKYYWKFETMSIPYYEQFLIYSTVSPLPESLVAILSDGN